MNRINEIQSLQTREEREAQGIQVRKEILRGDDFVAGIQFTTSADVAKEIDLDVMLADMENQECLAEIGDAEDYCAGGDDCMTAMELALRDALASGWLTDDNAL